MALFSFQPIRRSHAQFWHHLVLHSLVLFLVSCTGSPPEILGFSRGVFWDGRIDPPQPTHLGIELSIRERDGVGDIEFVRVTHPGRQLEWSVPAGDIDIEEGADGVTLILPLLGYEPLGTAISNPLPQGTYEVSVVDLSGTQDFVEIFLAPGLIPERLSLFEVNSKIDLQIYTTNQPTSWIYDEVRSTP